MVSICLDNKNSMNARNRAFYEKLTAHGLRELAIKGGLASGCDMLALKPYWSTAQSILDVGAGYGRAIEFLIKHQFQGKITAIERCHDLFSSLHKQFSHNHNINLLNTDIINLPETNERFEVILMLWSAIADFSPIEQLQVIKKLSNLLKKEGKLIVDTMPEKIIPLLAKKHGSQTFVTIIENTMVETYEPNAQEIRRYAKKAGFSDVSRITCTTDINRERWLYILNSPKAE